MNFEEWRNATYRLLEALPPEEQRLHRHLTLREVEHVLRAAMIALRQELRAGGEFRTRSLGILRVVERPARTVARNLPGGNGRKQTVPPRKAVWFRPSKGLNTFVNTESESDESLPSPIDQPSQALS